MKKSILLFVLLISSIISFSCSGDDDSTNLNETAQKLIGTWGDYGLDEVFYKKFTFRSDSKVEYYTYPNGEPILEEIGDWSMDGDILTMEFPETVLLVFVQKVVFTNDDTVQFIEVSGTEHEAWEGTYYRE